MAYLKGRRKKPTRLGKIGSELRRATEFDVDEYYEGLVRVGINCLQKEILVGFSGATNKPTKINIYLIREGESEARPCQNCYC